MDDEAQNVHPDASDNPAGSPVALEHAGVNFPPPLVYLIGFLAGASLEQAFSFYDLPRGPASLAGFVIMVVGIVLSSASVGRFRRANTSVMPNQPATALVTSGPYNFTRNPIYVALALAYAGTSLIVGMIWPIIVLPVVLIVVDRYVIRKEERYLDGAFGEEYRRYKASVRRWL